jgi:hypothetical protein
LQPKKLVAATTLHKRSGCSLNPYRTGAAAVFPLTATSATTFFLFYIKKKKEVNKERK